MIHGKRLSRFLPVYVAVIVTVELALTLWR